MKRANELIFERLAFSNRGVRFFYLIDNKLYSYFSTLDNSKIELDYDTKHCIAAHIGLSYLIDLANICCPKRIKIKTIKLSPEQLDFWKWIYENIAIERAYDEKNKLLFLNTHWETFGKIFDLKNTKNKVRKKRILLAVSGGKESLTVLKIFEEAKAKILLFFFDYLDKNSFCAKRAYAKLAKKYPLFKINSSISHTDALSKKYRCKDYSLFVIGQLIFNALLVKDEFDYLVIGNEYSSNFGNTIYRGQPVNHQFDKTIEFAQKVNTYVREFIDNDFTYFSPFFGFYEYKIAKRFFSDKKYLDIWTSCNNSNKKHNFCCQCSKCAFIYIVSLPFINNTILNKHFWKNPLKNLGLCKPLIDFDEIKPTDCVGEKEECWLSLYKASKNRNYSSLPVVEFFGTNILPKIQQKLSLIESKINEEHTKYKYIPKEFKKLVMDQMR